MKTFAMITSTNPIHDLIVSSFLKRLPSGVVLNEGWPNAPFPPISAARVRQAEEELGFDLPALLRRLYTEVANGGIGPGSGILGIGDGAKQYRKDLVELHKSEIVARDDDPQFEPPPLGLLGLCEYEAGITSSVWCLDPSFPIVRSDPNLTIDQIKEKHGRYEFDPILDEKGFNERHGRVYFSSWVEAKTIEDWFVNFLRRRNLLAGEQTNNGKRRRDCA